jgi:hypothetical protein
MAAKGKIFCNIKCIPNCITSNQNVSHSYTIVRVVQNERIITTIIMKLSSL